MSRRVVSQTLALKIWEKCVDAVKGANDVVDIPFSNDRASWDTFLQGVNDTLDPLHLAIKTTHVQSNGQEICMLVNAKSDDVAQVATDYTATEITYFKAVVEQIMLAPHESYSVTSLAALREVGALKINMTKSQAEIVLSSFVANGWLTKSKHGRYSLSLRTLIELESYLRNNFPDELLECTLCEETVTEGIACYTANCKARLHTHCYAKYKRQKQICPACSVNWSSDANLRKLLPIGEEAFKTGQEQSKRRTRPATTESDESEDEMDMDMSQPTQTHTNGASINVDEEEATPPPRAQRRIVRRR
ncbi:uncharacterized protein FIBRA_04448 [Fibroporia radiculosa]|uniref:Non-structural maintenance of chromosomes element 1 homolog n=1 Tax=Fibroporia radiculosa TaxID=599839 RepID=J4G7D8_9APHY|nr:uncharacterized protein FIBRA_04448 [Fibroporia radiculosa]CCM02353.1 predicted protein [Fibroporia radiculosa]